VGDFRKERRNNLPSSRDTGRACTHAQKKVKAINSLGLRKRASVPLGAVAHVAISDAFIVVIIVNPRPPHPSAAHVCVPSQQLSASTNRNWFLLQVRAAFHVAPKMSIHFSRSTPLWSLSLLQVPQIRRSSSANLTPSKSTCDPSAGF